MLKGGGDGGSDFTASCIRSSRCSIVTSVRMSGGLSPCVGSPSVTRITLSGAGSSVLDHGEGVLQARAAGRRGAPERRQRLLDLAGIARRRASGPALPSTTGRGAVSKA